VNHQFEVALDSRGAHKLLHHAPTPLPGVAFGDDETLAERPSEPFVKRTVLVEGVVGPLQDVFHQLGTIDQEEVDQSSILDKVAVVRDQAVEEPLTAAYQHA